MNNNINQNSAVNQYDISTLVGWTECDSGEVMTLNIKRTIGALLDTLPKLQSPLNHLAALIKTGEAGRTIVLTSGVRNAIRELLRAIEVK